MDNLRNIKRETIYLINLFDFNWLEVPIRENVIFYHLSATTSTMSTFQILIYKGKIYIDIPDIIMLIITYVINVVNSPKTFIIMVVNVAEKTLITKIIPNISNHLEINLIISLLLQSLS